MNYKDQYFNQQIIREYKTRSIKNYNDYDLFFFTYTFLNSLINLSPKPALDLFYNNLKSAAVNRAHSRNKCVKLLCIFEKSLASKNSKMIKNNHCHGLIAVPKPYTARFFHKAVKTISYERCDRINSLVKKITICPSLYRMPSTSTEVLSNYDLDVRYLLNVEDVDNVYDYATKGICFDDRDISLAQISEHEKYNPFKKQLYSVSDEIDYFLPYGSY